jgi:hypothetical protein
MAVGFSNTNKPLNPRGQDASPKGYNRAALYSGKALDFDGVNDKVAIHDATDLWTGDFSVSWYGNLDATGNQFAFSSGIYHGGVQAGINFWYGGASNTNFSAHFPESDGTGQQGYNLTLAESYEYWHRIDLVFVSSSRLLSLYQNGILVDTATVASNVDAAYMPNGWEFGNSYGGAYPLNGKLTNLKAFNVALTAAQVADLYNNPEKVVPTGVDNTALKLWLPMMEGAGTTAYDGSPVGFTEDIVTGFTNGTTYPLDSFASSGDDITTAIKTSGFGGCVSNGHTYTNGQKVKVKFTYQKNSGDNLRVLFSNAVTGAGTAKSDVQNVSASGEFEHTFTMTADGVAYLQLGTGNASHSIDAVITDVYVSPNVSANHGTISGATYVNGIGAPVAQSAVIDWNKGSNIIPNIEVYGGSSISNTTGVSNDPAGRSYAVRLQKTDSGTPRYAQQSIGTTLDGNSTYVLSSFFKYDGHAFTSSLEFNNNSHWGGTAWVCPIIIASSGVTLGTPLNCTSNIVAYSNDWYRVDVTIVTGGSPGFTADYLIKMQGGSETTLLVAYAQVEKSSSVGAFVPTFGTAQPSEVLLPQGLTTGRDITGVNLFENVRKQGALNLDGNSWAEVHDNASLDVTTGLTLEAWCYPTEDGNASGRELIGKFISASAPYQCWALQYEADKFGFGVGATDNTWEVIGSTTGKTKENWYHVVATYDGATRKIYINGVQDASGAYTKTPQTTDENIAIGRWLGQAVGGTNTFFGPIAQPRIYNRALTASEVLQNYNSGKNTYK